MFEKNKITIVLAIFIPTVICTFLHTGMLTNNWVKYIGNQSVPVFNSIIQSVIRLTMDDKSSCKQLAEVILQDASLTSRVIRVANSPYYNRCNTESDDIRRVILLIGFKRISEICLTLSILDSLTDKHTRKVIYKVIAKSFHAAIQARSIAGIYNIKNPDTGKDSSYLVRARRFRNVAICGIFEP